MSLFDISRLIKWGVLVGDEEEILTGEIEPIEDLVSGGFLHEADESLLSLADVFPFDGQRLFI